MFLAIFGRNGDATKKFAVSKSVPYAPITATIRSYLDAVLNRFI